MRNADAPIAIVEGIVQPGDRRGRELGFPTANVHGPDAVRLDGVYAGILRLEPAAGGRSYVTAVSVGHRPTFYGRDGLRLLEAHLLDFDGDLYGIHVRVELHIRLRRQVKYIDDRTLTHQLRLDVDATRVWARTNVFEGLLVRSASDSGTFPRVECRALRSEPVIRRKKKSGAVRSAERQERREQQLRQAIVERGALEDVSPEWLAQRVGVPVGYARWYLASLER